MRLIFVRHGHPDYQNDCLTDLGHLQAEAAAKRLYHEGIQQIYSSTCGRAFQTAEHTAQLLGISEIIPCDFLREIRWGSTDGTEIYSNGQPWYTAEHMVSEGNSLMADNWREQEPFCRNIAADCAFRVAKGMDALLASLGYQREGYYYRTGQNTDKTIAVFSHGGSSSAALSHLLNLPFPFVCGVMPPNFTAVSILKFSNEPGLLITPKIELFNDARHIATIPDTASSNEKIIFNR